MPDNGEIMFSDEFDAEQIKNMMRDILDDCRDERGGPNVYITQWVVDGAADEFDLRYSDVRLLDLARAVIKEKIGG